MADLRGALIQRTQVSTASLRGALADWKKNSVIAATTAPTYQYSNYDRAKMALGLNLVASNFDGFNFEGFGLMNANFSGASLREANFSTADLKYAIFFRACLARANLSHTNMRGANLREADLTNGNLQDANLSEADLCGAILRDCNMANIRIGRCRYNFKTIWPQNFDPRARGAIQLHRTGA